MMNKIYQGESLNLVFKCRDKAGSPVEMTGMETSVLLRAVTGEVAYRFSTRTLPGVLPVTVDRHYVVCRLTDRETAPLSGVYVIEVKVRKNGLVMIDLVKKIRVYDSVIGEDLEL